MNSQLIWLKKHTVACIHIPTYQRCNFCPVQEAAWAAEDASSCVLGETGAERMGLWAPGLIGQSCSTC